MKTRRGFTLIELLVVIAIIGILSSVVVTSLNSARKKARDARRVDDIKQMQLALDLYFDTNGKYPAVLSALTPTFIPSIPTNPTPAAVSGEAYRYVPLSSCASYHLGITLEDPSHIALQGNMEPSANPTVPTTCGGGTAGTDFAGTNPMYDVMP